MSRAKDVSWQKEDDGVIIPDIYKSKEPEYQSPINSNPEYIPPIIEAKAEVIQRIEPSIEREQALELATRRNEEIENAIVEIRQQSLLEMNEQPVINPNVINEKSNLPEFVYTDLSSQQNKIGSTLTDNVKAEEKKIADEKAKRKIIFFKELF